MTIKELCKKYNCNYTSMYNKFNRKKSQLDGHYNNDNGILQIDEYAESVLKPNEVYAEKSNLIKKGKNAELEIERANERCQYEISRRREFEKRCEALKKENDELKARLDELEQKNSELKAFKENCGQKPKGLFNRR